MMDAHALYFNLLTQSVFSPDPESALADAAALGRVFIMQKLPPEDFLDIHHRAVLRLARENPDLRLRQIADRLTATLMEVSMAYSLGMRREWDKKEALSARLLEASRLEAVGTMAAGIAHDFNTILGLIQAHAELLKDEFKPDTPGAAHLRQITAASFRARDLVQRMLAFARQKSTQPVRLDVVPLIREALEMMRVSLSGAVQLVFTSELATADLMADPMQIQQVVMNLCVNATDAMGGSGLITLHLKRLTPAAAPADLLKQLCLEVVDTGCGMKPEVLKRVFDPFYTTKAPGHGSGLGLSVVHGIVTELKGVIQVESTPGVGSRFRLMLPYLDADPMTPNPEEI